MGEGDAAQTFTAGGGAYDAFMGRYSIALAPLFARFSGVAPGQRALDVGCGPGALTAELVRLVGAQSVLACDPSPSFLAACLERHPGVDVRQGRAEALPLGDHCVDVALAQLVLHFVTDPDAAVRELRRVVRPGGRVALCVWDFDGGMQMLRAYWEAAVSLDPQAPDELETMRFGRGGELTAVLAGGGLLAVTEGPLTVSSTYTDFEELWASLLLGIGPAGSHLVSLPPEAQSRLRIAYRERLGATAGPISLTAVARAAVGTVPG